MFEQCNSKEEVMKKIFESKGKEDQYIHLDASKRFLELGLIDESINFYLIHCQQKTLYTSIQITQKMEEIFNNQRNTSDLMMKSAENNQSAAFTMRQAAEQINNASIRMSR